MIYELQTRTIDGVDYYCGTVIKRETGTPDSRTYSTSLPTTRTMTRKQARRGRTVRI